MSQDFLDFPFLPESPVYFRRIVMSLLAVPPWPPVKSSYDDSSTISHAEDSVNSALVANFFRRFNCFSDGFLGASLALVNRISMSWLALPFRPPVNSSKPLVSTRAVSYTHLTLPTNREV